MNRIIITGASDGLAKQLALKWLESNIEVVALCRRKPDYECNFIKTDLSKEVPIIEACNEIKNRYNKFDALINCAGVISLQKVNAITYEELNNLMLVNSVAPVFLTSQLMNLIKENHADIINVGSTCGTKAGYEDQLAYTTSKWGIRGTSYNLQAELKKYNSRVIQINVGGMNTKFHTKYNGEEIEHPEDWMNPKDIADIMLYTLNLPKNIEVSEITINRKNVK